MEFFSNLGSDPLKPSIFELIAQEQLRDLLQPALKYILAIFAQSYPRYLLRIVNRHEEFYAALMLLVERYYLRKHNASFAENFYGLKRRRRPYIQTDRTNAAVGGIPAQEKLRGQEISRSLLFLVGVPYLRAKAHDYFEELGGGVPSDVIDDQLGSRQLRALTEDSYKARFRRVYKAAYPWLNAGFEVWLLICNIAYLFDQTPFYRPWLAWIGVDLRRLGPEDFRAAALAAQSKASQTPGSISARLRGLFMQSPRLLLDSLRLLLPTAIFAFKFLEWWYSPNSPARSLTTSPLGPAVPPPQMLPPHPQGIPFDSNSYGQLGLSMKFGKHIQSQQVPGWSNYYLDYKFLKKIISSLAANRPASEAAALASGVRPSDILGHTTTTSAPAPSPRNPPSDPVEELGRPPIITGFGEDADRGPDYRAHKAAFFFKLERELEKINAFYLQKEAELKLRLETLLSKRRAAAMRGFSDTGGDAAQNHVEWRAVEEGFRLLERDLGKLQQFIEVNATGFRKILKKFDKRAKATTKELYLSRQVDVQPVFNRQLISELSDTVAACLLDLTDLSSGLKFEGPAANDIFVQQIMAEPLPPMGPFRDLENNLHKSVATREESAISECIRYSDILAEQVGSKPIIARILWNALLEAPSDLTDLILNSMSVPFDFRFVDDINERTCLHTASMSGSLPLVDLCIQKGVPVDKTDIYGRTALHYASMKGHQDICRRLLQAGSPANSLDRDNYTPLIYATLKGSVDCVRILLDEGRVEPGPPQALGDLSPLAVASQYGHVDVVVLLLQYGARSLANGNGEYPMHLAAREGRVEVCKVLITQEGWDTPDKYHEWTPLFHAARYGQDDSIRVLLDAGAKLDGADELGHLAIYYAAWYGHQKCLEMILEATTRSHPAEATTSLQGSPMKISQPEQTDIDLIPSLSLPPPIMPHRVYGHNYLDRNHLVQVTIGHTGEQTGVRLHHRLISPALEDEYIVASTPLKLVMTTSQGVNSAPYTVSLPQKNTESFTFQIPSLSNFSLEFSVYPNFGTKTIGRAVALPSMFSSTSHSSAFTLPILDTRLHVIGEVDVEVKVITSFEGVTLEVGGDVETYWKSLTTTPSVAQLGVPQWPHRSSLIGSAQASPSVHSITNTEGQVLTISSVQGSYFGVVVQVTRDLHPVVFSDWLLPESGFEIGVSDVTLEQFEALARRLKRDALPVGEKSIDDWSRYLSNSMISLAQLLKLLPLNINLSIELAYPSCQTRGLLSLRHRIDLNVFADSVLRHIYHGSTLPGGHYSRRQIIFLSYSPDICTVLNWKQPNYPVFFASRCGKSGIFSPRPTALGVEEGKDPRLSSVGAAVEFAKSNNLLGVFVDADLLVQVPSLINGIRNAGLLVGVHGESNMLTKLVTDSDIDGTPVDAYMQDSRLLFTDHSIQEML